MITFRRKRGSFSVEFNYAQIRGSVDKEKKIAILSKYDFYFEDIKNKCNLSDKNLLNLNLTNFEDYKPLKLFKPDFVFIPHWPFKLPTWVHESFHCIGFHTGNLPDDKGGSPIQNKILRKEYDTFVNAFELNEKLDGGKLMLKEPVSLKHGRIEEILKRISLIIAELVYVIISNKIISQDIPNKGIRFTRLSLKQSEVNIDENNLESLYNQIRMVDGLDYPKAVLILKNLKIEFSNAFISENKIKSNCEITILNGENNE
jgi:methionyl-tRNA formyltransferase